MTISDFMAFLGVLSILGLFGNIGFLIYRLITKKSAKPAVIALGSCFVLIIIFILACNATMTPKEIAARKKHAETQKQAESKTPSAPVKTSTPPAPTPPPPPTYKWTYEDRDDVINNSKFKLATTLSVNNLSFKFPYGGEQLARIMVRKNHDGSHDVMIAIEKGQFMVSVMGGSAMVRFDDNPAVEFSLNPAADGSTTIAFLRDPESFLSRLYKAKKTYIQTEFYNEGRQVMEFDTDGLQKM